MKPLEISVDRSTTLIVAELSANHGGSLTRAVETIHAAAEAGADCVKIQTYTPDTLTIDCDREEFRIHGGLWDGRTLYDLYREAHTPWDWHGRLFEEAAKVGIPIFSTPFDKTAVKLLEELGAPAYKIASFEIGDLELLLEVAATGKPVIMSTGMAALAEVDIAVRTIRRVWGETDRGLALLKCVSAYPAEPRDANLRTIPHLAQAFSALGGLSDHTPGTAVAVASVALGARVIEKHFTLDRRAGGPDSAFSIEPEELRSLVRDVRAVEAALGEVHYGPSPREVENVRFRRSIFVVGEVKAGERFTRENVRVIRPGYGMAPHMLEWVLGRKASVDIARGTPLKAELVE